MDVTRGDRTFEPGEKVAVDGMVQWRVVGQCVRWDDNLVVQNPNGDLRSVAIDRLSHIPSEVVNPPDFDFGEVLEYRTSVGPWLPARWVGVDPVNDRMGVLRNDSGRGANVVTVGLHDIRRPLPDVVTLTLSYRRHEVSEEMSVEDWRGSPIARAARALAEKVDGEENHDG